MKLQNAALRFDRTQWYDGYTGEPVFLGQLGLYDDTKRDSETAERRVLSLSDEAIIPARRVVMAAGRRYIVGHANPDHYKDAVVRIGYVVHEATELSNVRTLGQACRGEAGFSAWAGRAWIKNLSFSEQDSHLAPQHHFHFATNEPLLDQQILTFESRLYLARTMNRGAGGTLIVLADEMPEPCIESATATALTDRVNDTYGPVGAAFTVLRMRWQSLFRYQNHLAPKFSPGDIQVAISKTALTAVAGMRLALSDGSWQLADALSEGDVWLCRAVRRA